ncbi:MAG TPA: hypothetical protein VE269_02010 [Gaiellaceae bacterium]|nr:hypothetical protein [Gaiellaceae bacterium]
MLAAEALRQLVGHKSLSRFVSSGKRKCCCIADLSDDPKVDALVRLQVACRLALEALAGLPEDTQGALREPVQELCTVTERELDALRPGWSSDDSSSEGPTRAVRESNGGSASGS